MERKYDIPGMHSSALDEANFRIDRLQQLIEINSYIANSLEKETVLKRILQQVEVLLQCESCSILLVDRDVNMLRFAVMSRDDDARMLKNTTLSMGEGVAGSVWGNGMPVLIPDVRRDPRFSDRADKKSKTRTRSLIAVPLTVDGEIIGVVEAINRREGTFDSFDMLLLQYVSTQSAIAIKNADLYDMAIRDGMTRLYIHKYFRERLSEEWGRSVRFNSMLSLVFFDIDHFKTFNDTYGHQAGDRVLKGFAMILAENCRTIDIPCRYGGEEFSVILPGTDASNALIFANRIRKKTEKSTVDHDGIILNITVSGGVASRIDHCPENMETFISMADRALYASKNNGRNRISVFDPSSTEG